MNKSVLTRIFLRSFFIHTTLNFRRMQNLGFTMAIIPLVKEWNLNRQETEGFLTRHLQTFNTHPYLSAAVLGSVIRLEEEQIENSRKTKAATADTAAVKQVLTGPYAAIGDSFFWGALRPFAAIVAGVFAFQGYVAAPLFFLLLYTPAHIWVRLKGFLEGYRRGKQGIEFIRFLDLPRLTASIRWLSLVILALWAVFLLAGQEQPAVNLSHMVMKLVAISAILTCILLIKKRISQFYILYGAAVLFFLISLKEYLN